MTYLETVTLIRSLAIQVNPTGTFIHGRRVDGSLAYDGHYPQILLEPFTTNLSGENGTQTANMSLGFMFKDAAENNAEARELIIGEADVLCTAFIAALEAASVGVENMVTRPFYNIFAGVNSGYLLTFNFISKRASC